MIKAPDPRETPKRYQILSVPTIFAIVRSHVLFWEAPW